MQILRADPIHPIRKRLWQAALVTGIVMAICMGGEAFTRNATGLHHLSLGEDFLPVYSAGILVAEGHSAELYDMKSLARIERETVQSADLDNLPTYGPFLNPPFFAAAYTPFSRLPYRQALTVWVGLNLALLGGSMILLCRMFPVGTGWRCWGLVPLLLVLPLPFWAAMFYQQNSFVSLFLLCIVVTLWRSAGERGRGGNSKRRGDADTWGRGEKIEIDTTSKTAFPRVPASPRPRVSPDFLAGLVAGLLFYKPQLALTVAAILVLTRGWRALLGLAITGCLLLIFTSLAMPGSLTAFVHALPPTIHWMRTQVPYNWGRQATPQSFWRLMLQGGAVGETHRLPWMLSLTTTIGVGIALAAAVLQFIQTRNSHPSLDRLIAATIVSMPLIMPYYMDYDLVLFAIPAVLLAVDWMTANSVPTRSDRILLGAWAVLFFEFYINPGLATRTGMNLAPPLLGIIATLSIARCFRSRVATAAKERYDSPLRAAAA
jgi:hypothetical protein